jgi:hypothetical protein
MDVEVRDVVDARRDVAARVPVEQHPLERDVGASRNAVGKGDHVLLHVHALGLRVDVAFVRAPVAAVHVGVHRQAVERRCGKQDADRGWHSRTVGLHVARDRAMAERQLPAEAASRLGLRIRRRAAA